jgi:hypothetical protein
MKYAWLTSRIVKVTVISKEMISTKPTAPSTMLDPLLGLFLEAIAADL